MQSTKTIQTVVLPPDDGSKRPGTVKFTDGTEAQYWPADHEKFTAPLEGNTTAICELEVRETPKRNGDGVFRNNILKSWGEPAKTRKGAGGEKGLSPEDRRSITLQSIFSAACNLHSGTGDAKAALATVKLLLTFHDGVLAGAWSPTPNTNP